MLPQSELDEIIGTFVTHTSDNLPAEYVWDCTINLTGWEDKREAWEAIFNYCILNLEIKEEAIAWVTHCEVKHWEEYGKVTIFLGLILWKDGVKNE